MSANSTLRTSQIEEAKARKDHEIKGQVIGLFKEKL